MKDLITALLAAKAVGGTGSISGKGEKGDKGDKGDTGAQGPAGSDANVTAANIQNALGYTPVKPSDIPTVLKNPHSLTFTGAASGSYDGSAEMSVHVPYTTATVAPPYFAPSLEWLEENGDTSTVYVLPDGYLYAMQEGTVPKFTNLFDPSTALLNTTRDANGETTDAEGVFTSDIYPITCRSDTDHPTLIRIRGIRKRTWSSDDEKISYFNADKGFEWYISIHDGVNSSAGYIDDNGDYIIKAGWTINTYIDGADNRFKHFSLSACVYGNYQSLIESDIRDIIITVDEEITYTMDRHWTNTGIRFVSSPDEISPLFDKRVLVFGDSITADYYGNYTKWVTVLQHSGFFSGNVVNSSIHGTGFVARYTADDPSARNNFVERLTAISDPETYDLVMVFGGINDFFHDIEMGEDGQDKATYFKPAVNYFFEYLITHFPQARIVVMSPLRIDTDNMNTAGCYQRDYAEYIREVAKKYCFPVLNLTDESGYCPFVQAFKDKWTLIPPGYTDPDGVHPNAEYQEKYLAPMIKGFLSGLYGG